MVLTLKDKEKYIRNRNKARNVILNVVKKEGGIVFGARAVNKQVPAHLKATTEDYDIFIKDNPKKFAKKIERKLDRKFKGNYFEVQPALHEGTYKIISRVSKKGKVDVSKQPEKVGVIKKKGVKYADLEFQKRKIKESLSDPKSKFRHDKDKFTRLRIQLSEKKVKSKPRIKKKRFSGMKQDNSFAPKGFGGFSL